MEILLEVYHGIHEILLAKNEPGKGGSGGG
jgi:hypothetical protein